MVMHKTQIKLNVHMHKNKEGCERGGRLVGKRNVLIRRGKDLREGKGHESNLNAYIHI